MGIPSWAAKFFGNLPMQTVRRGFISAVSPWLSSAWVAGSAGGAPPACPCSPSPRALSAGGFSRQAPPLGLGSLSGCADAGWFLSENASTDLPPTFDEICLLSASSGLELRFGKCVVL
eukprot:1315204-Pyramimonas_sp.AAC.1